MVLPLLCAEPVGGLGAYANDQYLPEVAGTAYGRPILNRGLEYRVWRDTTSNRFPARTSRSSFAISYRLNGTSPSKHSGLAATAASTFDTR
jgi:hypothetical protein